MESDTITWVEKVAGWESGITILALIIGACYALFGDWRKSKEEREHDRQLARQEQQRRKDALEQQARRLRWDQANMAREVNHGFLDDPQAWIVLELVDCDRDTYTARDEVEKKQYTYNLKEQEAVHAMRIDGAQMSEKEVFLRECFDAWFYWMALMEQYLTSKLILQRDIDYPSRYYLRCLFENEPLNAACMQYLKHYGIEDDVVPFMNRFRADRRTELNELETALA
jgi:hypothetical protein